MIGYHLDFERIARQRHFLGYDDPARFKEPVADTKDAGKERLKAAFVEAFRDREGKDFAEKLAEEAVRGR